MKILFKQQEHNANSSLRRFGIQNCYFRTLTIDRDRDCITRKTHHHLGFEIHFLTSGCQQYEVAGTVYTLEGGTFLLIYPHIPHTVIASTPHTKKYSIMFTRQTETQTNCFFGTFPERVSANLSFIADEGLRQKEISSTLIENSILEILVSVFRLSGIKESRRNPGRDENVVVSLAKQYIEDNIDMAPCVGDVAEYCCLSTKQFTRLFQQDEGVPPGKYILRRRIARIEELLADRSCSLKQISCMMHFDNEYYFNAFFKKQAGMPPGEYRKMLTP